MSKLITFFMLGFIFISIIGGVVQGGGGIVVTRLTTDISPTDTTIPVLTTTNYLAIDYIVIDNEKILYSSKDSTNFYVASNGRGYNSTIADYHNERVNVHSSEAGVVNSMAGYNIGVITDATGIWAVLTLPFAILKLIGNTIWINFTFLGTDLAILSYIWIAMGIGLIMTVAISIAGGTRIGIP